ncbi:MAG: hypothetical protein WCF84_22570 [Anaerolineae bacterium]
MIPHTQNDYDLLEVVSALQKEIRRGNEEQAMYWALELVPHFEQYLWKRLTVIVNEDIGIANPLLLQLVPTQRTVYFDFRTENRDGSARLALANAILLMCRSPKSRIADHFQCAVNQDRLHGLHLEVPDYALDKHTGRGKRRGRDVQHWLTEGCQLNPVSEIVDGYAVRAADWWRGDEFIQTDYKNRGTKKGQRPVVPSAESDQLDFGF